jgi:hypothetical protein
LSKDYGSDIEPVEDNNRNVDDLEPVVEISRSATSGLTAPAKKKFLGPLKRLKAKQNDDELAILKTLAQAVATPEEKAITTIEKTEDEDDAFGRFIVTEMRSICDYREKLILKNIITKIPSVASVVDFKFSKKIAVQRLLVFSFIPRHSPHPSINTHLLLPSSTPY